MKKIQIVLISILLVLTACRKDNEISGELFIPNDGGELVAWQLMSQVINQEGFPVINAIVRFQQATTLTNEHGVFSFSQMDLVQFSSGHISTNFGSTEEITNYFESQFGLSYRLGCKVFIGAFFLSMWQ